MVTKVHEVTGACALNRCTVGNQPREILSEHHCRRYILRWSMALTHKPQVLFSASMERMAAARRTFHDGDYPLAMYLSGLAVECILQAVALRHGAAPDARHNLVN